MVMYTISEIATLTGAHRLGDKEYQIDWLLTDSRSLCFPESTLFFALRSARGDGHRFIEELYNRGVRNFVVDHQPEAELPEANLLLVPDTRKALQRLAERHRETFDIPIIGIIENMSYFVCPSDGLVYNIFGEGGGVTMAGEGALLILAAGNARIDNGKFKARFGMKAKMLPAEKVEALVGHAVGGVCPFAVNPQVTVYLDASLKKFETVFPACGSANSAIELTIPELEQFSQFKEWIDVTKNPEQSI